MIVVDNSVLIGAIVDPGPRGVAAQQRLSAEGLLAPALIDVEAVNVIRGLVRGGRLTPARAQILV